MTTPWPSEQKLLHYNTTLQLQKVTINHKAPLTSGYVLMCSIFAFSLPSSSNILSQWLSLQHLNITPLTEVKKGVPGPSTEVTPLAGRKEKGQIIRAKTSN